MSSAGMPPPAHGSSRAARRRCSSSPTEIAGTHHEWWDGTGYPNNLAGDEIPISGRIVAVADVFDALTHDRPYKSAWSVTDSVREMHRLSGLQFDPAVIAAFDRLDHEELAGYVRPEPARKLTAVG